MTIRETTNRGWHICWQDPHYVPPTAQILAYVLTPREERIVGIGRSLKVVDAIRAAAADVKQSSWAEERAVADILAIADRLEKRAALIG